jgi:hypothetical protein
VRGLDEPPHADMSSDKPTSAKARSGARGCTLSMIARPDNSHRSLR